MDSERSRLRYIDFYKGVCILFVIITHCNWSKERNLQFLFPFWINMAVPIFMTITGYLSTKSFEKGSKGNVFGVKILICKLVRFLVPVIIASIIWDVGNAIIGKRIERPIIILFLRGDLGAGGYYIPVIMQVIILTPILYSLIKRSHTKGIILCFALNLLFEVAKTEINLPEGYYRICALRYIFVLASGIYFYLQKDLLLKPYDYFIGNVGLTYIIVFNYTNNIPYFTNQWTATSVFSVLYIFPIMKYLLMPRSIRNCIIELLGWEFRPTGTCIPKLAGRAFRSDRDSYSG